MAVSLKHQYESGVADEGNATLVQPTDWNAEHTLTLATDKLLGRVTAGTGAVEEVTFTDFAQTLLDDADAGTARTTLGAYGSGSSITVAAGSAGAPGLNFTGATTTGLFLSGTAIGFSVGGSELAQISSVGVFSMGQIRAAAGDAIYWNTRSAMDSASNGNIRISNNAQNDFGLLQLGGTTSSFPALKRSTTKLVARLADDSANTHLTVADDAYDATSWNGNNDVPTKNAIRDKIETMSAGSGTSLGLVVAIGQIGCVLP